MNIENSSEEKTLLECIIENKKILGEKYFEQLKADECIYEIFENNKEIKDKIKLEAIKEQKIVKKGKEKSRRL